MISVVLLKVGLSIGLIGKVRYYVLNCLID